MCWSEETIGHQIVSNSFGFEVELETLDSKGKCWVFLYLSPNNLVRADQWQYLVDNKSKWVNNWFLGGDLNDIRKAEEKQGGRLRTEASFLQFQNFIDDMGMDEINFKGRIWT